MNKLVIWIILAVSASVVQADGFSMKCRISKAPWFDMTIDLEKGTVNWWLFHYDITKVTDRYITAIRKDGSDVGGELLVLDRVSGEFDLAGIYRKCTRDDCSSTKVGPDSHHGQCKKPLL